jgi:Cdc6-like AAA superfamily ATPase
VLLLLLSFIVLSPIGLFILARLRRLFKERATRRLNVYLLLFAGCGIFYAFWRFSSITEQFKKLSTFVFLHTVQTLDLPLRNEAHREPLTVTGGLTSISVFWLLNSPLIVVGVSMWHWFEEMWSIVKPRTLAEQVAHEEERWKKHTQSSQATTLRAVDREMPHIADGVLLGAHIYTPSVITKELGILRVQNWVGLQDRVLDEHLFILGATGSGKTETIKRIIEGVAQSTERDIIFVDGKGDREVAQAIQGILYAHGRGVVPILRLGEGEVQQYNAFCGDRLAIYNRLAALVNVEQAEGNAVYYANKNRRILKLICNGTAEPPRSFTELEDRLSIRWLGEAYKAQRQKVEGIDTKDIGSLGDHLHPLIMDFADLISPDGFALEDRGGAIFSIRTSSYGDTGRSFVRLLIEDIKDYVGNRQMRPALLVIDEFGQFGNENIIELLSMARSSQLGIVLATQTEASLGDELTQEKILGNTMTKILHRVEEPEKIAARAGTQLRPEVGAQIEDGKMTGMGTVRWQHQFVVPMGVVRELPRGQAFIIRSGKAVQIQVKRVAHIPVVPYSKTEEQKTVNLKTPDELPLPDVEL